MRLSSLIFYLVNLGYNLLLKRDVSKQNIASAPEFREIKFCILEQCLMTKR